MVNICPFCLESVNSNSHLGSEAITCPRCGVYSISDEVFEDFDGYKLTDRQKVNISGWLRENAGYGITTQNMENLSKIKTPSFHERADKLLLELEKTTDFAGQFLSPDNCWISSAWCFNESELNEILAFLIETKRIRLGGALKGMVPGEYKIEPDGWEHLETLKKVNMDSQQGFVAMWFDPNMQSVFDEAISPGVLAAGYRPHLVNMREHNGKIDDEIISQIRRSRFVLADFTGHRGGVYYEAGFGKGLGLEVFWTCRKDEIDKLHFDIRQYNCIDWEIDKLPEFRKRIANRIESVIGRGTYK